MLKQRVLTALVLALILLGAIWGLSPFYFTCFVGVIVCFAAWEWSTLAGFNNLVSRVIYISLLMLVLIAGLHFSPQIIKPALSLSLFWWMLALICIGLFPSFSILWKQQMVVAIAGLVVIFPCWLALNYLRGGSNYVFNILMLIAVVAAADIGAYCAGRTFGKHKLAPNVSPSKTWEGVLGGALACLILLLCVITLTQEKMLSLQHYLMIILSAILLLTFSVVGDLFESLLKRSRGVKDSGNILPGHGGILDRIDGILATAPMYTWLMIQSNGFFQ